MGEALDKGKLTGLWRLCIAFGLIGFPGFMISSQTPDAPIISVKHLFILISLSSIVACFVLLIRCVKNAKAIWGKIRTLVASLFAIFIGSYIIVFLFIFIFQDIFIINNHFLFDPSHISEEKAQSYVKDNVEEIKLNTKDNVQLRGWYVKNSTKEKSPLVIYFGGSGTEVSYMIDYAKKMNGWSTVLINYRGYGLSEGMPSEENMINDAVFIYDTFSQREDVDNNKIIVMGWSLGANVSAILSSKRHVAGTILVAPSDSETHWFQFTRYPYIPLGIFRTKYFDAVSLAPTNSTPLLCFIAEKDTSNPPALGKNLVSKWKGKKTVIDYKNEDHHLLFHENSSWDEINKFLHGFE